jgi:guanylate kinase
MMSGKLIMIAAPSGCGKTTIAKAILQQHPQMLFSVSATTRAKRDTEIEGRDHFFLTKEEFQKRLQNGDLAEWEEIYGNFYGTLKSEIQRALNAGQTMLFDIDVKGALSIQKCFPNESTLIFIKPPSFEELKRRLESRNTENPEALQQRLERVPMELAQADKFDIQVVNDDLQAAVNKVNEAVLHAVQEIIL